MPPVLGAVEEWLAFNAFVRRAGERQGRLSLMPRGGLERDGDELLPRARRGCFARSRVGALPSSDSEMQGVVEGSRREPSREAETTLQPEKSVDGSHRVSGPHVGLL